MRGPQASIESIMGGFNSTKQSRLARVIASRCRFAAYAWYYLASLGFLSPLNDWNWCGILRSQIIGTDSDFYEDFDSDFDFDSDLDKDLFDFNVDFDTDWVF